MEIEMTCTQLTGGRECGAKITPKSKFCKECGKAVQSSSILTMKCPGLDENGDVCAVILNRGEKFCSQCGRKITDDLWKKTKKDVQVVTKCWQCGETVGAGKKFCSECGAKTKNPLSTDTNINFTSTECSEKLSNDSSMTPCDQGSPKVVPNVLTQGSLEDTDVSIHAVRGEQDPQHHTRSIIKNDSVHIDQPQRGKPGRSVAGSEGNKLPTTPGQTDHNTPEAFLNLQKEADNHRNDNSTQPELFVKSDTQSPDSSLNPDSQSQEDPSKKKCASNQETVERKDARSHSERMEGDSVGNTRGIQTQEVTDNIDQPVYENPGERQPEREANMSADGPVHQEMQSANTPQYQTNEELDGHSKNVEQNPDVIPTKGSSQTDEKDSDTFRPTDSGGGNPFLYVIENLGTSENSAQSHQDTVASEINKPVVDSGQTPGNGEMVFGQGRQYEQENTNPNNEKKLISTKPGTPRMKNEDGKNDQLNNNKAAESGASEPDMDQKKLKLDKEKNPTNKQSIKDNEASIKSKDQGVDGKFYQKSATDERRYETRSSTLQNSKNEQKTKEKTSVMIHFCIVLSKDFHLSVEQDMVIIKFGSDMLGGWNSDAHIMECERQIQKGYYLMKLTVQVPKDILLYRKPFEYKYVVKKYDEKKPVWEHLNKKMYSKDQIVNRSLWIPTEEIHQIAEWYQYDAFVYPEPPNTITHKFKCFVKRLTGEAYDKICKESQMAVKAMLPEWKSLGLNGNPVTMNGETFLNQVDRVLRTTRQCFLDQEGDKINEEKYLEVLSAFISSAVQSLQIVNKNASPETPEEACVRLATAVSAMSIIQKHNLPLTRSLTSPLFDALLVRLDQNSKECSDYKALIEYHFIKSKEKVSGLLVDFLRRMARVGFTEPKWLFAVPLFHFLLGESGPLEPLNQTVTHHSARWWGTRKLIDLIDTFQHYYQEKQMPIGVYVRVLPPLFEVDRLLPRTLVAAVGFKHLLSLMASCNISPEIYLANLCYNVKTNKVHGDDCVILKQILDQIRDQLLSFGSQIDEAWFSSQSVEHVMVICHISEELLGHLCTNNLSGSLYMIAAMKVLLAALSYLENACLAAITFEQPDMDKVRSDANKCMQEIANSAVNRITRWMNLALWHSLLEIQYSYVWLKDENELKIYSELLSMKWHNEKMGSYFKQNIMKILEYRIRKEFDQHRVEFYCSHSFENYHKDIEECFGRFAFEALELKLMKTHNTEFLFGGYQRFDKGKLKNMLSRMFMNMWKSSVGVPEKPNKILQHITTWHTFTRYVSFSYGKSEESQLIDDSCQEKIMTGLSVFEKMLKEILTGEIKISDLQVVSQQQHQVLNLYTVIESASKETMIPQLADESISKAQLLIAVIQHRTKEVGAFRTLKLQLENFIAKCQEIKTAKFTSLELLEDKMKLKFEECKLSELCKPVPVTPNGISGIPTVVLFGLSPSVKDMLEGLDTVKHSLVFKRLWEGKVSEYAMNNEGEEIDMEDLVSSVWEPAFAEFSKIARDVLNGNLNFGQVDDVFGRFKDNYDVIHRELKCLCGDRGTECVVERLNQIKQYHTLDQYQSGAKVMLEVKNQFRLEGDFTLVETLAKAGQNKKQKLMSINKGLVAAGRELSEITTQKQKAIEVFSKCQPLIEWLKESIKGPKEVKVLVDLAMISATGEGDLEVQRVSCLHAAVTGYAPLIYDLNQSADFNTFLGLCRSVWQALKADKNLPKKLEDTNRNLTWLKSIKESHGSVEVSTLFQAESINSRGIFQVGNIKEETKKTVANSILLKVAPEESQKEKGGKWKEYNLSQLNDLQSKLMLVAGKGEKGREKVERFVEIYDGITRLANTYVKICAAGSILFQKWKATFYCEPDRNVNVSIELGLSQRKLQGSEMEVTKQIQDVCKFMEECLDDWLRHIEKQRTQFCYLNHFTTTQLVILSSELAKLAFTKEGLSHVVYPMLRCVKADCSETDIRKAIQEALAAPPTRYDIQGMADMEWEMLPGSESENAVVKEEVDSGTKAEKLRAEFTAKMEESGFTKKLAERALVEVSAEEIDEGIMWCLEHVEEEEKNEDLSEEDQEMENLEKRNEELYRAPEPATNQETYTLGYVTETLLQATQGGSSLKSQLEQLWTGFLGKVDTSVSDYLSIEHLGGVLEELAHIGNKSIKRPFPAYLNPGKPNLIICNESDMFLTVLSIYMSHDGRDLPLPGPDEVLLCSEKTTEEEVDLLWRRASEDRDGKIFCLVAADLLDYDVSQKAEQLLEKHQQGDTDYKLVVLCSHEREDKAHLVTALDRHRVNHPIQEPIEDIREYLQKHFTVHESSMLNKPAAFIDPQNLCVRLIKSHRAGVGKSHRVRRLREKMETLNPDVRADSLPISVTIQLQRKKVDVSDVLKTLVSYTTEPHKQNPRLFHFDIGHNVQEEVDYLLFNLLVLGSLTDSSGYVWLRSPSDIYVVETMPLMQADVKAKERAKTEAMYVHHILALLPSTTCWSPMDSLEIIMGNKIAIADKYVGAQIGKDDQLMDKQEFESPDFQRPYQYLKKFDDKQDPSSVDLNEPAGSIEDCLRILMKLEDFATRSLNMSEETPGVENVKDELEEQQNEQDIIQYIIKKRWETSPHPYVFFNSDGHTLTFLGFFVDRQTGDIRDPQTNNILQLAVMPRPLQDGLTRNRVTLNENFDALPRLEKIRKMCYVMGIEFPYDPDPTYELTTDNVKKILAIYMRFRCGIPVVIMGETGCGKTRLIKFMCDLQKPPGVELKNMVLMKVHGGTTERDIQRKVDEAGRLAEKNQDEFGSVDTVLFFDEANTTEAIGMIKEIMCDGTINGHPLQTIRGLKLVAACNPYRKHSDEMIKRLEQAGLGYHVQAEQTRDKLGRIPMRQLVYRVQALPRSMLPLVWDFGQLSTQVEELYIKQMVLRFVGIDEEETLPNLPNISQVISSILAASQDFMRQQQDECSFVSLRDVERVMNVMMWFYKRRMYLFELINQKAKAFFEQPERGKDVYQPPSDETRALILALGVCYHACLQNRQEYRECVAKKFQMPCCLVGGPDSILREITWCQDVFLESVQLGPNIARNKALKENLFMMVVCIELRIPLFLVGKPGSSKSLAKTIVADAMQGDAAHFTLFKYFKLVHMVSFQCSPLSTPDGIVGTFRQCAKLQQEKDLDKFVSVVVLDEVGLAEDSPTMPLKTLHPLLEDGCEGDEEPQQYKKVAFIGISNWALDPAKMNRGIHVQRGIPDEEELVHSANGICATDEIVQELISKLMRPMSQAYLELYNSALEIREFFGLRDFYGLVKMVYGFSKKSGEEPTWYELQHSILRNFGGLDKVDPLMVFDRRIKGINKLAQATEMDPNCDATALIKAGLEGDGLDSESRYLLILTENYAALGLLAHHLLIMKDTVVIFGSSFPKDQEYTQVCRNINKIKVCMETGKTVVLLNLENLYESLYDALNQYYVYLGGDRFVDLGLGTQRVKCRVHPKFRLIVVAEKQVVYKTFPIPLINRLEKHFLAMSTVLTHDQIQVVSKLEEWAKQFAIMDRIGQAPNRKQKLTVEDVFIGYNADTAASIVLQVCRDLPLAVDDWTDAQILEKAQDILLQCCTPDAIIRLEDTKLSVKEIELQQLYFNGQKHGSLLEFLLEEINEVKAKEGIFAQVTTHSRLLSGESAKTIASRMKISHKNVHLVPLQAFDTEQQFCKALRNFFNTAVNQKDRLMLLQCDSGDKNGDLIACARHIIWGEFLENKESIVAENVRTHVVFIIQLPRIAGGCFSGFEGGRWTSYHIDELLPTNCDMPFIGDLKQTSISKLFEYRSHTDMKEEVHTGEDSEEYDDNLVFKSSYFSNVSAPRGDMLPAEEMDIDVDTLGGVEDMNEDENIINPEDVEIDMEVTEDVQPPTETCTMNNQFSGIRSTKAVEVPPCNVGLGELSNEVEKAKRRTVGEMLNKTREALVGKKNKLDVERLIFNCVHSAGAMLKDPEPRRQRKTHRVQLLTKLLVKSDPDDMCLMEVLKKRIYHLMKEKEENVMTGTLATSWLSKEVASVEAINKAGTLSRSLMQYLESKVTSLLAGLVAYMDTNGNLDILEKAIEESDEIITELWLSMMESLKGCTLTFIDFQSATRMSELTEFQVLNTGCDGTLFDALCPFSWIIKSQVDTLVHRALSEKSFGLNTEGLIMRLLNESPLGTVINKVLNEHDIEDLVQRYLHDYIRMVHKPQSQGAAQTEYKLVTRAVCCAARENHIRIHQHMEEIPPFTLTIPGIHLAFQQAQKRLMLFSQAVQLWPECVERLPVGQFAEKTDNILLTETEMTLDVQLLCLILEFLTPNKKLLDNVTNREEWSNRAEMLLPIIEMIFTNVENEDPWFGKICVEQTHRQRPIWIKLRVVQLFIKHVCPRGSTEANLSVKSIMPLWTMLKEDADLKKAKSLSTVENFLKTCNKSACSHFFGDQKICPGCKKAMSNPVELPCKHVCCQDCVLEMRELGDTSCPECRMELPTNFKPVLMGQKKEAIEGHNGYKQRCNMFFMELVTSLCFSGDTPPETEVIEKLMDYVTRKKQGMKGGQTIQKTKIFTVFDDSIDPTPVVRSFILQLLLRSNIDEVRTYLQEYFERSRMLLIKRDDLIELSILVVHCLEDYFSNQASQMEFWDVLQYAGRLLRQANENFKSDMLDIQKLEAVASTRYSLSVIAKWMHMNYIEGGATGIHALEMKKVLEAAEQLCSQEFKWPGLYLMRLLSRRYGVECLRTIGNVPKLQWVIPPEARENQNNSRPDMYVICGKEYKTLREALSEVLLTNNPKSLTEAMKKTKGKGDMKERILLLAIHREVTLSFSHNEKGQKPPNEVAKTLVAFCQKEKVVKHKDTAQMLISNQFGQLIPCLNIRPNMAGLQRDIIELVVHFTLAVRCAPNDALLLPLLAILNTPQTMRNAFLPTMPEDKLSEIHKAILDARASGGDHNPVLYTCPNGHPYIVGACGRPMEVKRCQECASNIGGTNHNAVAGNRPLTNVQDQTAPGHILGRAEHRPKDPISERDLSPASVAVTSLVLHLTMLVGATQHLQAITHLIHPQIPPEQVGEFLLAHTNCDLEVLRKALGRSRDDVLILLHMFLENVAEFKLEGRQKADAELRTKQSRQEWEKLFAASYIIPILTGVEARVKDANQSMLNDSRLGNNPLLRSLYEVDTPTVKIKTDNIENCSSMWRYRPRITLEHLNQTFNEACQLLPTKGKAKKNSSKKMNRVLQLFLHEEYQLRFLSFLPNILRLQRFLVQRFHRTIDSSEAVSLKIKSMLERIENEHQRNEVAAWVQCFGTAWDFVRKHLAKINVNGVRVPVEFSEKRITPSASLAMLLPSWKGQGICALAVTRYLVDLQNNFMEKYSVLLEQKLAVVKVGDASKSHIVSYHPDRDLLPLVLSNCNYSLSVGCEMAIEYNFLSLEKQIEERYIRGRPRLDYQYDVVVFREDYTNAKVFQQLRIRIPQEPLPQTVQIQLQTVIKHLPELCENLANIDICIGFLVSVGGEPERKLVNFMTETLKMETVMLSNKAGQCRLKHVESLWLVMSHERAKMLASYGQDPFDAVEDKYLEAIPQGQKKELDKILSNINLEVFLYQLFEALVLQLTIKGNVNDEDYLDNVDYPLHYVLHEFIEGRDGVEIPALMDGRFPQELCVKHAIATWRRALYFYNQQAKRM